MFARRNKGFKFISSLTFALQHCLYCLNDLLILLSLGVVATDVNVIADKARIVILKVCVQTIHASETDKQRGRRTKVPLTKTLLAGK